jgi:hypothetical protein
MMKHERNTAPLEFLCDRSRFIIREITAKDSCIDRLPSEQRQRVVMASGERYDLTSGILDHQIELRGYERVILNDQHASTVERWYADVFFHVLVLPDYELNASVAIGCDDSRTAPHRAVLEHAVVLLIGSPACCRFVARRSCTPLANSLVGSFLI